MRVQTWRRLGFLALGLLPFLAPAGPPAPSNAVTWYVRGPFPVEKGRHPRATDYLADEGGEENLTFEQVSKKWKRVVQTENDTLDFHRCMDRHEDAAAYAARTILAGESGPVSLRVKADDGMVLWLNGKKIATYGIGDHRVPASLVKGTNFLLAKVDQGGGGWDLYLAITPPIILSSPVITPNDDGVNDTVDLKLVLAKPEAGSIDVLDSFKRPVRRVAGGKKLNPSDSWSWNGKMDDGRACPPGLYTIRVTLRGNGSQSFESRVELRSVPPLKRQAYTEARAFFPVGMFYASSQLPGDAAAFAAECRDMRAHGLNAIMLNNFHHRPGSGRSKHLETAGQAGLRTIATVGNGGGYYDNAVPADEAEARKRLAPYVEDLSGYPGFLGYYLSDEPRGDLARKLQVAARVIEDLDPSNPPFVVLAGLGNVRAVQGQMQAPVLCIDPYAVGFHSEPGEFGMGSMGNQELNYSKYIDLARQATPTGSLLWVIVQTHNFQEQLREPTPAEVSAMSWLALGHGAKGIFWFIYQTEQGWRGLKEDGHAGRYGAVEGFAKAIQPLLPLLVQTDVNDKPAAECQTPKAEICGLRNVKTGAQYLVCVNGDVTQAQTVAGKIISWSPARLRDLVTGKIISVSAGRFTISLPAGGGTVLGIENNGSQP